MSNDYTIRTADRDAVKLDICSMLLEAVMIAINQYKKDGDKKWYYYAEEIRKNEKNYRKAGHEPAKKLLQEADFGEWS